MAGSIFLLSAIVFLPALGALLLAFLPKGKVEAIRWVTLIVTLLVLAFTIFSLLPGFETADESSRWMQETFNVDWIPSFNIHYYMGLDGISLPLVVLTAFICVLAMAASWPIKKHVKGYCILFLLLETGMLGVFMSLDFFLFYVFWEVMLLPMYFLIGVWGGPKREYAAIKFFLYTLIGSVLMLIAILMLFFNSDLKQVVDASNFNGGSVQWDKLNISASEEAELGIQQSDSGDVKFALWRKGGDAEQLVVQFHNLGESTESARAEYSPQGGTVDVFLNSSSTGGDLVSAINENDAVKDVLRVAVPNEQLDKSVAPKEAYDDKKNLIPEDKRDASAVLGFSLKLALATVGEKNKQEKNELKQQIAQAEREGNDAKKQKLEQELEKLERMDEQMQRAQDLADKLSKVQQNLAKGNRQQAADQLDQVADQLQEMQDELNQLESQLKTLDQVMDQIAQAKNAMGCKQCGGKGCASCKGQGNTLAGGDGKGDKQGRPANNARGKGAGAGFRPEKENDTGFFESKVDAEVKRGTVVRIGEAGGANVAGLSREQIKE
ncbi:MAG: hypothetical protein IH991_23750, partial [Planctomycetes bacterium]|nr:hypothetical protein [Planctomycetota bacterium]